MKFHWGHGIVLSFVLFASMIGYMVTTAMNSDIPMVSKDYYRQEANFNTHAEAVKHAKQAGNLLHMEQLNGHLQFFCPPEWAGKVEGEIYFYRPSDAQLDFKIAFIPDQTGIQTVATDHLAKGYWRAKLKLHYAGKPYFKEYAFQLR
ncbi:MAG: FixH family protein [Cytophagales bacterium]|nr:FixH family protein [Bernardetiaceae bacterium]MDW8203556.1 FixH family protein [Cytophagales bacterium]